MTSSPHLRSSALLTLALVSVGCGRPPEDYLEVFVRRAGESSAELSARKATMMSPASDIVYRFCDVRDLNRLTSTAVELKRVLIGGALAYDPYVQTWSYAQTDCDTDGISSGGVMFVNVARQADLTWTLEYEGWMWLGGNDKCSLSASATADENGVLLAPPAGTFCDAPLDTFGVDLMVPDFFL